jgi:hypothetical protein
MCYFIADFIFMVALFVFIATRQAMARYNFTIGKSCADILIAVAAIRSVLATRVNADLTFITRVSATSTIARIVGGIDTFVVTH